jgi:hypothetical protein
MQHVGLCLAAVLHQHKLHVHQTFNTELRTTIMCCSVAAATATYVVWLDERCPLCLLLLLQAGAAASSMPPPGRGAAGTPAAAAAAMPAPAAASRSAVTGAVHVTTITTATHLQPGPGELIVVVLLFP